MHPETKTCQNCKEDFTITSDDFGFYEKIKVPPPTFCPPCRKQRRMAWRNDMSLYSSSCKLCSRSVISIYAPDSGITTYCNKCWWSDAWDPKSYAREYDFSKPFFTQFRELITSLPHMSIVNDDGIASTSCEYTHDWWFSKNCYMCFCGWKTENSMYCYFVLAGKDMVDCMNIKSKNEFIYECVRCATSYKFMYSQHSKDCIESAFLSDCLNCSNCFMCAGIRGQKYCFKNEQYSEEEYKKILESYRLDTSSGVERARKEFKEFMQIQPKRYARNFHNDQNIIGEEISYSKNLKYCFSAKKSENCRYSDFFTENKDCYDILTTGGTSESYEGLVMDHSQRNRFGVYSVKSQDIQYSQHCHNCKYIFGCVGLRNASYCIFNTQYTKEEYEALVPKIIEQMNSIPYIDKNGARYAYGEFYPTELSLFGYNETLAQFHFPLTKEEIEQKGYRYQEHIQRTTGKETLKSEQIPDSIHDVTDSILNEVLTCITCKRNYKIIGNELIFYKKMIIPIPRQCFYCRHAARFASQNPFKLWHRECMCDKKGHLHGEAKCQVAFETTWPLTAPDVVYCEKCYQQEVY